MLQIIIFLILVFIYLHIRFQLKVNNNLEVYEIDYDTNENLQKICDIRVPLLFDVPKMYVELPVEFTKQQGNSEINIKDAMDELDTTPVKLSFFSAKKLIEEDNIKKYYSEKNSDFLEESNLKIEYKKNDSLFSPQMTAITEYDIILGSRNVSMPFKFHTNYRSFLYVSRGQATVRMCSWKNSKNFNTIYNWKDFNFYSQINVWNPQSEYENIYEKIKFIDIIVPTGKVVYIPPYCWYSVKLTHSEEESETIIQSYSYKTYMNLLAISPKLILHLFYPR